jgi:hypothetical protein
VADSDKLVSSAMPTEPPTCCVVFTVADAMPDCDGAAPAAAELFAEPNTTPSPSPAISSPGRTEVTYSPSTSIPVR